ncbi:unnamed protein product [Urochloa humidicola]
MRLPPRGSPCTGPLPPPGRADSGAVELTQLAPAAASARAHRPRFLRLRAQAPLLPPMEGSSVKEMVEEEEAAGIRPSPAVTGSSTARGWGGGGGQEWMTGPAAGGVDEMEKKWKICKSALTVFCNFDSFFCVLDILETDPI